MNFTGGKSTSYQVAGGITDLGTLTLTNSVISGSSGNNGGGLIVRYGAATLTDCTISGNAATFGFGGGINSYASTVTLTDCTVSGNSGGGILSNPYAGVGGILNATGCSISGNTGKYIPGIQDNGSATLTDCTISGNANATNPGGGISVSDTATLTNCTISGNTAPSSGGLYNFVDSKTVMNDCTVSGNAVTGNGGGIGNVAPLANFTIANSIVAGNTAKADPDAVGAVNSLGFNLIGATDGSSGWGPDDFTGTAAHPLTDKLGPLANNGGPTQTLLPLGGSPVIDQGDNALIPTGDATDQRGLQRVSNGTVDIGAVEVQTTATTPITLIAAAAQAAKAGQSKLVALGSFAASKATGPFKVHVHWGDGTADSTFSVASAGKIPAAAHTFPYAATDTVIVTVTDSAGHVSSRATFVVSVTGLTKVVVNSVSDTASGLGVITLRDAITIADRSAGPTTITFDPKVFAAAQKIALNGSVLELGNTSEPTAIIGPAAAITVDGGGISGDIQIDLGVAVSMTGMNFTGGKSSIGGGIQNNGTATLTDCTISGNTAYSGGGISNYDATATLTDCTVSDNHATGVGGGGGVNDSGGAVTLTDCTLSDNTTTTGSGGGISVSIRGGSNTESATLINSTVSGNTAARGGGIYNHYATTTVTDCVISGNTATGTVFGNGGGILNWGATLTLTDSTVAANFAPTGEGGAIFDYGVKGVITVANCTVSSNSASTGGGICNASTPPATFSIANTIVAGNTAAVGPDADGAFTSSGFNLTGQTDDSTGWVKTDLTGTTAKPLNADLGPLANNHGPTLSMLPLPGSPAIGAGSVPLVPKGDTTDQRGLDRIVTGKVDIGAVELQRTVVIKGTVFYDANDNGILDPGETGLAGVQVYADLGNVGHYVAGDPTTLTNAVGAFTLKGIAETSVIRQVPPTGDAQTAPPHGYGQHLTIPAGDTLTGLNFGDRSDLATPSADIIDASSDGGENPGKEA
jgi:hypothetical protein